MTRAAAAGLCVLGLLCLQSGGLLGQDLEEEPEALAFCDDPLVNMAAKAAVISVNQRIVTGNIVALYQILSASMAKNASGVLYSIKFNSRRSDCPAEGAVAWTDCGYAADDSKPIMCNATVFVSEGVASTQVAECDVEDPVQKDRVACLGCPEVLDLGAEDLKVPLSASISKYNSHHHNGTHLFMLSAVGYATRQVVAGLRYRLYFDMRKSNCSKTDHAALHPGCAHDKDDVELANCNSTVDVAEWRHEVPQANLECDQGPMEATVLTRRRPPGWSPLRNVVDRSEGPTIETPFVSLDPSVPPPATPVDAAFPDESSEEEGSKDDPFHCPSKPWKKFSPGGPAGPAGPAPALSDLDLLG